MVAEQGTGGERPLAGVRFVEMAGIGPVPFAAMLLGDLGASGVRVEAPDRASLRPTGPTDRGRAVLTLDLKDPVVRDDVRHTLIGRADLLIEGYRPGAMERLGLGPAECRAVNPRLVYGRMTGWGQEGPLARTAGHDITYLAVTGALHSFARRGERPVPPLNLVADYGGGAMLLVAGVLAALLRAARTGVGQVVDAAMVDGVTLLLAEFYGLRANGMWRDEAGTNLLDSGAPFYDVYPTRDGRYVAVGALEPRFYAELLHGLGLADAGLPDQYDPTGWPVLRERFGAVFATRTRDEWAGLFAGTDACVAPVLDLSEAPHHPHLRARAVHTTVDGVVQPAAAPRFDGTVVAPAAADLLRDWGLTTSEIAALGHGNRPGGR